MTNFDKSDAVRRHTKDRGKNVTTRWQAVAQDLFAENVKLVIENSNLRAWASGDAWKSRRLVALLIRADAALAACGVGRRAAIRMNINAALEKT